MTPAWVIGTWASVVDHVTGKLVTGAPCASDPVIRKVSGSPKARVESRGPIRRVRIFAPGPTYLSTSLAVAAGPVPKATTTTVSVPEK